MNQIKPIVSIILTSYNKPSTVGKAIESIMSQTYRDWELFVMDDNSNSDTVKVIQRYLNDPRIHYYNSSVKDCDRYKTTRYATLINEAIPKTKGKYITYLTDDNIYLPKRLRTMVHYLEQKRVDIVYSRQQVYWFDENGKERKGGRRTYGVINNAAGLVDHCSVMHTRAIAEKVFKKYGSYWDDHPKNWNYGDAAFWNRLTEIKPFYPIRMILDVAWKGHDSFQKLYTFMPSVIPDGTIIRGLSNDIYLIDKQKRRRILPQAFNDLKYDVQSIVSVPDPFLFKYSEGVVIDNRAFENFTLFPNQRLIMSSEKSSIFYIQNNKKHLIRNTNVLKDFYLNRMQVIIVSKSLLEQIPDGQPIGEISQGISLLPDGVFYKIDNHFYISLNNHFHKIEETVAKKLNLPITNPVILGPDYLTKFPIGEPFIWEN